MSSSRKTEIDLKAMVETFLGTILTGLGESLETNALQFEVNNDHFDILSPSSWRIIAPEQIKTSLDIIVVSRPIDSEVESFIKKKEPRFVVIFHRSFSTDASAIFPQLSTAHVVFAGCSFENNVKLMGSYASVTFANCVSSGTVTLPKTRQLSLLLPSKITLESDYPIEECFLNCSTNEDQSNLFYFNNLGGIKLDVSDLTLSANMFQNIMTSAFREITIWHNEVLNQGPKLTKERISAQIVDVSNFLVCPWEWIQWILDNCDNLHTLKICSGRLTAKRVSKLIHYNHIKIVVVISGRSPQELVDLCKKSPLTIILLDDD